MLATMVVLENWIKDSSLGVMDVVAHFQQLANFDAYVWGLFNPQWGYSHNLGTQKWMSHLKGFS